MDFFEGLLAGWGSTFNSSMRDAREKALKDRQYELEQKKYEEEMRYKQDQQNMMKPYYDALTRKSVQEGGLLQQKTDLLRGAQAPFDDGLGEPGGQPGVIKPTSSNGTAPWVAEESGGRVDAINPRDGKGSSFGIIQANAPSTQDAMFRKMGLTWDEDGQVKSWLPNVPVTDPQYHAAYKSYVNQNPEFYKQKQMETADELYFKPIAEKAQSLGLDVSNPAIKNSVLSASIQHGVKGASDILEIAKANGDFSNSENAVNSIFKARASVNPSHSERYERERAANLDLIKGESIARNPQVSQGQLSQNIELAAGPTNSMTDAPNGYGGQSRQETTREVADVNRVFPNATPQALANAYAQHKQAAAKFEGVGVPYPNAGKMALIEKELNYLQGRATAESNAALNQTPKKYINLETGNVEMLTNSQLSKVKNPNAYQEYDERPGGLDSRMKQYTNVVSNLIQQELGSSDLQSLPEDQAKQVALARAMQKNPNLFRNIDSDSMSLRNSNKQEVGYSDRKGNKLTVEKPYDPNLEDISKRTSEIKNYNKVGHENVANAFATINNEVRLRMQNGMSEQDALASVKADPNTKAYFDTIESAYNGGEGQLLKSGRQTAYGNNVLSKMQEKNVTDVEKELQDSERYDVSLKQALVKPGENVLDITDDVKDERIAEHLNFLKKKGINTYSMFSKLLDPNATDISPELKQYATQNLSVLKMMDERFFGKRKETTGVVFSPAESASYGRVWGSSDSSPEDFRAVSKNERIQNLIKKDYIESMKKTGTWDKNEAIERLGAKQREQGSPQINNNQQQSAPTGKPSFMRYGD